MIFTPLAIGFEFIVFLFIIGSSIVKQLMQANQQPPKGKQGARPKGREKTDVEREIEAFLRGTVEAKHEQEKAKKRAKGEAGRPPQLPPQRPVAGTARKGTSVPPRRPAKSPSLAQSEFGRGESVADHVDRHIVDEGVASYDPPLADQVNQADERLEQHLHEAFDHKLGKLKKSDLKRDDISEGTDADVWAYRDSSPTSNAAADRIRKMLSNPQDVAAAFVLSEILRPVSESQATDEHG